MKKIVLTRFSSGFHPDPVFIRQRQTVVLCGVNEQHVLIVYNGHDNCEQINRRTKHRARIQMPKYWCANFDAGAAPDGDPEYVLRHGLEENLWLMQYQYSHDGHTYQGGTQKASTTKSWKAAAKIEPSDWLVAYLRGPTFFAVGKVVEPRERDRHHNQPIHADSIARTVKDHRHNFFSGTVRYPQESDVFYEDFTDSWFLRNENPQSGLPEVWRYPQRIDVEQWECRSSGVEVEGVGKAVGVPLVGKVLFEIPEAFFEKVRRCLQG